MKIHHLPEKVGAICFDIDRTLYTNEEYAHHQIQVIKNRLGEEKGWTEDRVETELDRVKKETGHKGSHGIWFQMLGISMATSVAWRNALVFPHRFLTPDRELIKTIAQLHLYFRLCTLTNNPKMVGEATLQSLGILDFFDFTIGLDDTLKSKPSIEPFLAVEETLGCRKEEILMIGDRFEVDLAVPLERGWGAVLVDSVEEVYSIPDELKIFSACRST